jgi:1,4-dihydroxy-2-naphthoate octaprenyltransferase
VSARPSTLQAWILATRPRTLVAGFSPVAVGSALAAHDDVFQPLAALFALVGALLIQVGTNLANDHEDFRRGADTAERVGPPRVTQQGWLPPGAVLRGALTCFALAFLVGLYLVWVAGWPILVVGVVSILAGYAYTGGPFPLAYHGLGDVFVLLFFGLVAVGGTYFVQAGTLRPTVLLAAIPVGLLGVALLAVNNTRDARTDEAAGKRTLVVRLGRRFGQLEYVACLAVSALTPVVLWTTGLTTGWVLLALLAAPLAVSPLRVVLTRTGPVLNQALAGTARLQLVYGLLFAAGLTR